MPQTWKWSNGMVTTVGGVPFDTSDVTVTGDWTFTGTVDLENAVVTLPSSFDKDWEVLASDEISGGSVVAAEFIGLTSTYRAYVIELSNVLPATDGVILDIQLSTDNGSTWQAGASYYRWANLSFPVSGAVAGTGSNGNSSIETSNSIGSAAGGGEALSGRIIVHDPLESACVTGVTHQVFHRNTATNAKFSVGGGSSTVNAAHNALRMFFSSGFIATFNYTLYGLRKA